MNFIHTVRVGLTALLVTLCLITQAQTYQISTGEYFVDTDPGTGAATPLTATDGAFNNMWEQINATVSALPVGQHTIGIRLQDGNGNWGPTFSRVISVENLYTTRSVNITAAEFFIDTDPGQGNATPLIAIDGNFNDALEAVQLSNINLSNGLHTLNLRILGQDGSWSPVFTRAISVESILSPRSINITEAEYFYGSDPGEGNGTAMVAFDGNFNQAWEAVSATTPSLTTGLHKFSLRMLGQDGSWSPAFSRIVSVEDVVAGRAISITQAEFFFDTDPGEGSGISMVAFNGAFDQAFEQAFEQALAENAVIPVATGAHTLGVRMRSTDGTWSVPFTTSIYIDEALTVRDINITAAEYFYDSDQGEGSGIPMLAFDGNFTDAFEQASVSNVTTPASGLHTLSVRYLGLDGSWSAAFSTAIVVEDLLTVRDVRITQAEYFWDTDPGAGNGNAMIAFDGNFNSAFEQAQATSVPSPSDGIHTLFVRYRGQDGSWSNSFPQVIDIQEPITVRDVRIVIAEFFFDSDPGQGLGSPLAATDGNFNAAFEKVFTNSNSGLLTPGGHVLHVRHLGLDGSWSNTFQTVVYVDPCLTSPTVNITPAGPVTICPEDSVLLTATAGLVSYIWVSGLNEVGTGQTYYADSAAFYRVIGFDIDGCPGVSANVQVSEYNVPNNNLVANGPLTFCSGGSVTLTASNGFATYLWSNGATSQSIVVSSPGTYSCVATTAGGCSRTSQALSVIVNSLPSQPIITPSNPIVCSGDDVTLSS
ncbi:MAG: hypothetical protein RL220_363, partial [Bacteroidota bacterium]